MWGSSGRGFLTSWDLSSLRCGLVSREHAPCFLFFFFFSVPLVKVLQALMVDLHPLMVISCEDLSIALLVGSSELGGTGGKRILSPNKCFFFFTSFPDLNMLLLLFNASSTLPYRSDLGVLASSPSCSSSQLSLMYDIRCISESKYFFLWITLKLYRLRCVTSSHLRGSRLRYSGPPLQTEQINR